MPAYTSLPDAGDNNNNLQSLSVDGYTLSPAFDKDVLTYEVTVDENTTSVNISATAESSKATVTGTGTVTIDSDTTLVTITVTPQVSIDKKYTITKWRFN